MSVDIVMPHLSDSMEEGTILQWLLAEGDEVKEGEPLVEVETDKASVTYEAEQDGVLLRIAVGVGESAAVGSVIAVIGQPGEAVDLPESASAGGATGDGAGGGAGETTGAAADAAVASERSAEYGARQGETREAGGTRGAAVASPSTNGHGGSPADPAPGERVKASPLARRIASELGVDLSALTGTGPQGRIVRADVERSAQPGHGGGGAPGVEEVAAPGAADGAGDAVGAAAGAAPGATGATGAAGAAGAKGQTARRELSRLQQTVARRMAESRATVPDFELRVEVDMTRVVELREQLRDLNERPPSVNDFIVKASALALREFPRVNGAYRDGAFEEYSRVNVGIAVAAQDALVVPTIFDADEKSLGAIASTARALAEKVRDGSITPAELSGGTFSVSNLGMYGIDSFSAVVNAPQAAILAAGSLRLRPVVDETDPAAPVIVARPTITLTLACDHRILYGADGARFLSRLRELLEAPMALLVG